VGVGVVVEPRSLVRSVLLGAVGLLVTALPVVTLQRDLRAEQTVGLQSRALHRSERTGDDASPMRCPSKPGHDSVTEHDAPKGDGASTMPLSKCEAAEKHRDEAFYHAMPRHSSKKP
jgi:hypothetical protein